MEPLGVWKEQILAGNVTGGLYGINSGWTGKEIWGEDRRGSFGVCDGKTGRVRAARHERRGQDYFDPHYPWDACE